MKKQYCKQMGSVKFYIISSYIAIFIGYYKSFLRIVVTEKLVVLEVSGSNPAKAVVLLLLKHRPHSLVNKVEVEETKLNLKEDIKIKVKR